MDIKKALTNNDIMIYCIRISKKRPNTGRLVHFCFTMITVSFYNSYQLYNITSAKVHKISIHMGSYAMFEIH